MFVLQFSWLNLLWINSHFILPFKSTYLIKYTSGYNYKFLAEKETFSTCSPYISEYDLSLKSLVNNFSFFPTLIAFSGILFLVTVVRHKLLVSSNSKNTSKDISEKEKL